MKTAEILLLYLTYEELKRVSAISLNPINVFRCCTLPMRNWNTTSPEPSSCSSSERRVVPYLWGIETILGKQICQLLSGCTLPMRNWNIIRHCFNFFHGIVVPYLWGIETILSGAFNFFEILSARCTLPMRNWNTCLSARCNFHSHRVLVVPYLWGIETQYSSTNWFALTSVVPYLWGIETNHKWFSSCARYTCHLLYLTYEELKPSSQTYNIHEGIVVPYLWGIETV